MTLSIQERRARLFGRSGQQAAPAPDTAAAANELGRAFAQAFELLAQSARAPHHPMQPAPSPVVVEPHAPEPVAKLADGQPKAWVLETSDPAGFPRKVRMERQSDGSWNLSTKDAMGNPRRVRMTPEY